MSNTPPQIVTPSQQSHHPLHVNTKSSQRSNHTLSTTPTAKVNPKFAQNLNWSFDLKYGDDEADGGCSKSLKNFNVLSLIKPWSSSSSATLDTTPTMTSKSPRHLQSPPSQTHPPRPPYSFSCLTFLAIESSERKRLSVKDIYAWIIQHFPYYHSVPSGSWKNSIRHNLSYNNCFCKVDKNLLAMRDFSGKGSLWCINPEFRPLLIEMLHKTPLNEQHKLARIPFFQDVAETPTTPPATLATTTTTPTKVNSSSAHGFESKKASATKKRSVTQPCMPTIINPKIISQLIAPMSKASASSTPVSSMKHR